MKTTIIDDAGSILCTTRTNGVYYSALTADSQKISRYDFVITFAISYYSSSGQHRADVL